DALGAPRGIGRVYLGRRRRARRPAASRSRHASGGRALSCIARARPPVALPPGASARRGGVGQWWLDRGLSTAAAEADPRGAARNNRGAPGRLGAALR